MGYLSIPLIIGIIALPAPGPGTARIGDFSRLQAAVNEEVYVIDTAGQERRLTLVKAGQDAVHFMVAQQAIQMQRDVVLAVDRVRDSNVDGTIKGALVGLLLGAAVSQAYGSDSARYLLRSTVTYGTIGYLFDRRYVSREPLYRAAPPTAASAGRRLP